MKLFAALILTAAAATSLLAASMPRCDISGVSQKGNVKLTPGTIEGGLQVGRQNWGPEETRPCRLVASTRKVVGPEWTVCKFVFTPEESGIVTLSLGGQWARNVEDRGWLMVGNLKINGTPVTNADMKKTYERNGRTMPNGFWLSGKKSEYVADGGPDGAAGVLVNHDNRLGRSIKVEAGKPVTVEYMAKAAEDPGK